MRYAIRQLCSVSLIICLLAPVPAQACAGPELAETVYVRLFRQDMPELDGRGQFYPDWKDGVWPVNVEQSNYADWKALVPGSTDADVAAFVYASTAEDIAELRAALSAGQPYTGRLADNAFAKHVMAAKDLALLDYMLFVKDSAPMLVEKEAWDYSAPDAQRTRNFTAQAEQGMLKADTEFLRLRYAYQALRLNLLQRNFPRVVELFETHVAPLQTQSEVKDWARSFYAGALLRLKEDNRAFIQFALVFQRASRYRQAGFTGCQWLVAYGYGDWTKDGQRRIAEILKETRTGEERLAVTVMAAYFETSIDDDSTDSPAFFSLLHDVQAGKKVPRDVQVQLGRELNKAEQAVLEVQTLERLRFPGAKTPRERKERAPQNGDGRSAKRPEEYREENASIVATQNNRIVKAEARLAKLDPLVMAGRAKADDPAFWGVAAAYIAFLRGDLPAAKERLAWALAHKPAPKVRDQITVLELALDAFYAPLSPGTAEAAQTEERLLKGLRWLFTQVASRVPNSAPAGMRRLPAQGSEAEQWNADPEGGVGRYTRDLSTEALWYDRTAAHLLRHVLKIRYAAAKQTARAALSTGIVEKMTRTFGRGERRDSVAWSPLFTHLDSLSVSEFNAVLALLRKPATPFEIFLAQGAPAWTEYAWVELEGTKLLRMHKFHAAGDFMLKGFSNATKAGLFINDSTDNSAVFDEPERAYGSLPGAYGREGPPKNKMKLPPQQGPLAENITLELDEALAAAPALRQQDMYKKYTLEQLRERIKLLVGIYNRPTTTKIDFAYQMSALKDLSQLPGEAGAKAAYIHAKGLYNMTYYGNSWWLSAWAWSSSERWERDASRYARPPKPEARPKDEYYRADAAREAFNEVAQRSKDPELQARALFMASLCTQGYTQLYSGYGGKGVIKPGGEYLADNPYFAKLQAEYADTAFYRAARDACSFLKDFTEQAPPVKAQ